MSNHREKLRNAWLLLGGGVAVATLLASQVVRWGEGGLPPAFTFALLLAIFGLMLFSGVPLWRRFDHMQKDARLVSWYWGGLAGAIVAMLALVSWAGDSAFTEGAMVMLLGQVAGYLLFWLGWRLRHRERAA